MSDKSAFWKGLGWCFVWLGFGGCCYLATLKEDPPIIVIENSFNRTP